MDFGFNLTRTANASAWRLLPNRWDFVAFPLIICVLALTAVLIALSYWRTRPSFLRDAFATNTILMTVGFLLTGYQIAGYYLA